MGVQIQATTPTPEKSRDEVAVKRKRELQPLASFRPFIFGVPNNEQPMQWKTVERAGKQSKKAQVTFAEPN